MNDKIAKEILKELEKIRKELHSLNKNIKASHYDEEEETEEYSDEFINSQIL